MGVVNLSEEWDWGYKHFWDPSNSPPLEQWEQWIYGPMRGRSEDPLRISDAIGVKPYIASMLGGGGYGNAFGLSIVVWHNDAAKALDWVVVALETSRKYYVHARGSYAPDHGVQGFNGQVKYIRAADGVCIAYEGGPAPATRNLYLVALRYDFLKKQMTMPYGDAHKVLDVASSAAQAYAMGGYPGPNFGSPYDGRLAIFHEGEGTCKGILYNIKAWMGELPPFTHMSTVDLLTSFQPHEAFQGAQPLSGDHRACQVWGQHPDGYGSIIVEEESGALALRSHNIITDSGGVGFATAISHTNGTYSFLTGSQLVHSYGPFTDLGGRPSIFGSKFTGGVIDVGVNAQIAGHAALMHYKYQNSGHSVIAYIRDASLYLRNAGLLRWAIWKRDVDPSTAIYHNTVFGPEIAIFAPHQVTHAHIRNVDATSAGCTFATHDGVYVGIVSRVTDIHRAAFVSADEYAFVHLWSHDLEYVGMMAHLDAHWARHIQGFSHAKGISLTCQAYLIPESYGWLDVNGLEFDSNGTIVGPLRGIEENSIYATTSDADDNDYDGRYQYICGSFGWYTDPSTNAFDWANVFMLDRDVGKVVRELKLGPSQHVLRAAVSRVTNRYYYVPWPLAGGAIDSVWVYDVEADVDLGLLLTIPARPYYTEIYGITVRQGNGHDQILLLTEESLLIYDHEGNLLREYLLSWRGGRAFWWWSRLVGLTLSRDGRFAYISGEWETSAVGRVDLDTGEIIIATVPLAYDYGGEYGHVTLQPGFADATAERKPILFPDIQRRA